MAPPGLHLVFTSIQPTITLTLDPSFETYQVPNIVGVNAIADISINYHYFEKLFLFKTDSVDATDLRIDDVKYAVDPVRWHAAYGDRTSRATNAPLDLSLANVQTASRVGGTSFPDLSCSLPTDMARHIAFKVTGGLAGTDIFSNEELMTENVSDTSFTLNREIRKILDNSGNVGYGQYGLSGPDASSIYAEFRDVVSIGHENLSREALLTFLNNPHNSHEGVKRIMAEMSGRTNDDSNVWMQVPLKAGDTMSFKVTYKPKSSIPLGNNSITDRSYQINVHLVDASRSVYYNTERAGGYHTHDASGDLSFWNNY
tara:strand:+ start:1528 stop:2469 length:942 start_codon:yes stop_codon:yes gene_type:complete